MSRLVEVKRTISLLVLLMAAIVALSGPVAEVLDLPAPVAEAKKKKKKKFNVVRCADVGFECIGTNRRDRLVGTPGSEFIFGEGGRDIYHANGGNTFTFDRSTTSSDTYVAVDPGAGQNTVITDSGGSADFLGMGSLRLFDDVTFIRNGDDLLLRGPELRDIDVVNHFSSGRIEKIKFANGTITGQQAESLAGEATPKEQAALEQKRPNDEHPPEDESSPQGKE